MNNQIKEEGLTDAYLLGKYDGIKKGREDTLKAIKDLLNSNVSQIYFRKKLEEIINEIN